MLKAEKTPVANVVSYCLAKEDEALLNPLAEALCTHPHTVTLLALETDKQAKLLFARSADLSIDMNALLQKALPTIEGRGGGRPDRAQGGGSKFTGLKEALELAKTVVQTSHKL